MKKSHVIISGTGRAGTTFLIQLLTYLGFDTGFKDINSHIHPNCNAGMEWDIRQPDAPYVVKSPWLCDYLDDVLQSGEVAIEHAYIPIRDLFSAAQSRIDVEKRTDRAFYPEGIPGGLWHTDTPDTQESILEHQLYKLIHTVTKHDVPMTLLHFPRLINDPEYLFRKMTAVLAGTPYGVFIAAFREVAHPELVHQFAPPKS